MKKTSPESLLTEEWFLDKLSNDGSGTIVETKLGPGITKNSDVPVNGKVPVYLNDGRKVLCSIQNIKIVGFYD
jgi:hypothetical protein